MAEPSVFASAYSLPLQDKLFKLAGEDAEKDPKWWADLRTASRFLMEAKKRQGQEITMTTGNYSLRR